MPAVVVVVLAAPSARAQTYSVLYSFHGKHGSEPEAGLTQDKKGNLYGTTYGGGAYNEGTVFVLKANG
ncbi:MAG: choice-of-anchor tandem repeat GloVer-containing protein, partial [Terriglobales bacterium]